MIIIIIYGRPISSCRIRNLEPQINLDSKRHSNTEVFISIYISISTSMTSDLTSLQVSACDDGEGTHSVGFLDANLGG